MKIKKTLYVLLCSIGFQVYAMESDEHITFTELKDPALTIKPDANTIDDYLQERRLLLQEVKTLNSSPKNPSQLFRPRLRTVLSRPRRDTSLQIATQDSGDQGLTEAELTLLKTISDTFSIANKPALMKTLGEENVEQKVEFFRKTELLKVLFKSELEKVRPPLSEDQKVTLEIRLNNFIRTQEKEGNLSIIRTEMKKLLDTPEAALKAAKEAALEAAKEAAKKAEQKTIEETKAKAEEILKGLQTKLDKRMKELSLTDDEKTALKKNLTSLFYKTLPSPGIIDLENGDQSNVKRESYVLQPIVMEAEGLSRKNIDKSKKNIDQSVSDFRRTLLKELLAKTDAFIAKKIDTWNGDGKIPQTLSRDQTLTLSTMISDYITAKSIVRYTTKESLEKLKEGLFEHIEYMLENKTNTILVGNSIYSPSGTADVDSI